MFLFGLDPKGQFGLLRDSSLSLSRPKDQRHRSFWCECVQGNGLRLLQLPVISSWVPKLVGVHF